MTLLIISSDNETIQRITQYSAQLYPGKFDISARSGPDELYDGDMEKYDMVIYDPELFHDTENDDLPQPDSTLLIPIYSLDRWVRFVKKGKTGGLFLNSPVLLNNFNGTISRAVRMLSGITESALPQLDSHHEKEFRDFLRDRFWQDVLIGLNKSYSSVPGDDQGGQSVLTVLPILIEIKEWPQEMSIKEKMVTLSMIKEIARRMLFADDGCVLQVRDDTLVALCPSDTGIAKATEDCLHFSEECSRLFSVSACCCIGEAVHASGLEAMFEQLVVISRENITGEKLMFLRFGVSGKNAPASEPDLALWKDMLLAGEYDPMLISVTEYFLQATAANRLSFENLRRFSHDFQQILYVVLQEKGIAAHVVFDNEKFDSLWGDAADSLSELLNWIFWSVGEISKYLGSSNTRQDKLSEVTEYIRANLSRELTRQELASRVHLSQSALARMFKSGTGMTLTEYIFQLRLESAKRLLQTPSIPIGEAAEKCGFRNYSYFYTRFKSAVGISPSEYRAQYCK